MEISGRQGWPGSSERGERAVAPRVGDWKIPVLERGDGRGKVDSWEAGDLISALSAIVPPQRSSPALTFKQVPASLGLKLF